MRSRTSWKAGLAAVAVSAVAVGLSGGVASAHVSISQTEQVAGSYTLLTFGVPHGCDGSATTQVRIQIPEEIPQVTPTVNPNWDVEKVMEQLDEPITGGHGVEITERVAEVVYTAHMPLPADLRDAFDLSLQTPDLPGETLYFPTVQICEDGESGWVELPTDAVPESELELPAPKIVIVAAAAGADGHSDGDSGSDESASASNEAEEGAAEETAAADSGSNDSGGSNALSVVALVVGGIGVALGGASLAMRRRSA